MVEVLVALVVMSVGMLGIAALYVTTLQAKTTSGSRMKAVNLAYDMADRIRANPTGGDDYKLAITDTPAAGTCIQTTGGGANCSAADMAKTDKAQWRSMVTNATTGLPGTVTCKIERTAGTTDVYTITLNWSEVNGGNLSYALQVQI